ncbi:hypothetical protein DN820_05570 [Stutzerimonas nosocomialis]|uniref:Uncharacterized protein n=1 Tax=Stutzerimonas nosocomialis TaxID=1056496 RepID=A0A5R9QHI1_9GAMM|nr:hypothetical protein [Stutzerimonas nosocomialis]TLX64510.1 hypothetical protein DN820_05570 [Stutzerimonas nosocomialis]
MAMTKQLLYFLYGGHPTYIREAKFSILTALEYLDDNAIVIRVMTDRPEDFDGWPVVTEALSAEQLSSWAGEHGYTHRKKACAMAAGLALADKTLFVDSDTFFKSDPRPLFDQIGNGNYLMDSLEWEWRATAGFKEFIGLRAALSDQGTMPPDDMRMYNSGVCGLTRDDGFLFQQSIGLIDQWHPFCAEIPIVEQVALSFALHGKAVHEANRCIHHYFGSKRYFHAMLALFFSRHGEAYRPSLVPLSREVPRSKPCPKPWWRLWAKWRLKAFSKAVKKQGRSIFYGCLLPEDAYSQACRTAWWDGALQDMNGGSFEQSFRSGVWPGDLPRPPSRADEQAALEYFHQRLASADQVKNRPS